MANGNDIYEFVTAWEVFETVDERGSRGGSAGVFSRQSEADMVAAGKGWYGGKGNVAEVVLLRVLSTGEHFKLMARAPVDLDGRLQAERDGLRTKALEKLTPEERQALGLSEAK
jgi:hypothetical protein